MQPALQDEPRRSREALGPSLAENLSKTDPSIPGQTAFKLAEDLRYVVEWLLYQELYPLDCCCCIGLSEGERLRGYHSYHINC